MCNTTCFFNTAKQSHESMQQYQQADSSSTMQRAILFNADVDLLVPPTFATQLNQRPVTAHHIVWCCASSSFSTASTCINVDEANEVLIFIAPKHARVSAFFSMVLCKVNEHMEFWTDFPEFCICLLL